MRNRLQVMQILMQNITDNAHSPCFWRIIKLQYVEYLYLVNEHSHPRSHSKHNKLRSLMINRTVQVIITSPSYKRFFSLKHFILSPLAQ